jgi:nucleoside-diphosphate-sugar epimerase
MLARAFEGIESYFSVSPLIQDLSETGIEAVNVATKAGVRRIVRSSVLRSSRQRGVLRTLALRRRAGDRGERTFLHNPSAHFFHAELFWLCRFDQEPGKILRSPCRFQMSLVDARDIADAAVVVLTELGHESQKYRITGGEGISSQESAMALSEALAKPVEYVAVSNDQAKNAMAGMGMPAWMVDGFLELYQLAVDGWLSAVIPDLEKLLGRKPRTFRQLSQDFRAAFV